MKLNPTSLFAYYYKWIFTTDVLPTNLCPFFWKSLFAILLIPFEIFSFPLSAIMFYVDRKNQSLILLHREENFTFEDVFDRMMVFGMGDTFQPFIRYILSFGLYLILYVVACMFMMFTFKTELILTLGAIGWGVTAMVICALLIIYTKKIIEEKKANRPYLEIPRGKKKWVVVEFVKAKYNKYCPSITWEK